MKEKEILFVNIRFLAGLHPQETMILRGEEMNDFPFLENAWLHIKGNKIHNFGLIKDLNKYEYINDNQLIEIIDLNNKSIMPTWCDSHTHLVFAAYRENEFLMKLDGKSYADIAAAGGGILNSAEKLKTISEDDLYNFSAEKLNNLIQMGTGAIEIKSGYGLNMASELKMLRVIQRLKQQFPIPIKSTFLGAHTYPLEYKENHAAYLNLIINEMLPAIHAEQLADFVDIFIEKGFFSIPEAQLILDKSLEYGLKPKLHINQLSNNGGVQFGVANNALSVDHLEEIGEEEIQCLKNQRTIATLLPACSFYLDIPFAPAKLMVKNGLPIAIASDFNPGSSPSGNMNFVVSLACIKMKILPHQAFNAATINGAYAMDLSRNYGSLAKGKMANFIITKRISSLHFIPYNFGENVVDKIVINGEFY
jgi:imidazolonepropionase